MTPDEALQIADEVLFAHADKHLTDLQRMILRESWADKSYMDMLGQGWELPTIRKAGNKLWSLLSEALGEEVSKTSFRGALEKRLKSGDIVPQPPMPSTYNQQTWVGREELINDLLPKLQGQTRLVWITGISGIGKTALGECLVSQAWAIDPSFQWIYLEILQGQSPDFPSVAADLLAKLGDRDLDPQERNDPDQLAKRLLQKLQSHSYWIQLDALERLLNPEQPTEFVDAYWSTFLQQCLTHSAFASRLVLTSQAFPNALVEFNDRYPNVWAEIRLDGLLQVEQQLEFFAKRGIAVASSNRDILARIAKIYEGHPLVLKVIAEDILKEFAGNVAHYWQVNQPEFEQIARELQAARLNETDYNEALDRKVRERIKKSLEQLPTDALDLLCRSAVFRRPVPKTFWLAMISDRTSQQQKAAYRVLGDRALVEKEGIHQEQFLIRQHNLIRDIAYELLREDRSIWEIAERQAIDLWLTAYEPNRNAPNLEKVRGNLEAFDHYCELEDWQTAKAILLDQAIGQQLQTWSYYQETIRLYRRLLRYLQVIDQVTCARGLGNAYFLLSQYSQATDHYQQSLEIAREIGDLQGQWKVLNNLSLIYQRSGDYLKSVEMLQQNLSIVREIGDRKGEGKALGNLGLAYKNLGEYQRAIDILQQALAITRDTGDRHWEGGCLGGLGLVYGALGKYQQAFEFHQQYLAITRETGDRNEEGNALGSLGMTYKDLGEYQRAIEFHQQHLTIAREIGDRRGEGNALSSLGLAYGALGEYQRAIEFHQQHLTIVREIGDRQGEGIALDNLGITYNKLGEHQRAIEFHQLALSITRKISDRPGEGSAMGNLGITFTKLEQYSEALENLKWALQIFQEINDQNAEAETFKNLAELHLKTGSIDLAREYCDRALALAIELGIPLVKECEELKAQLENEP